MNQGQKKTEVHWTLKILKHTFWTCSYGFCEIKPYIIYKCVTCVPFKVKTWDLNTPLPVSRLYVKKFRVISKGQRSNIMTSSIFINFHLRQIYIYKPKLIWNQLFFFILIHFNNSFMTIKLFYFLQILVTQFIFRDL